MLEKSCKTCGCPLFEVKGKTLCVVCEENTPLSKNNEPGKENDSPPTAVNEGGFQSLAAAGDGLMLAGQLAGTLLSLCERIRNEKDPNHVLTLMAAVKTGAESLNILRQL